MVARRQVYLTAAIFAFTLLSTLVYLSFTNKRSPKENVSAIYNPGNAMKVFVEDISNLKEPPINNELQDIIERRLYSNASQGSKDLFTGTVRPGSYSYALEFSPRGNIHIRHLEIDVEPTKATYLVTIRESKGSLTVAVVCAPQEHQMSKAIECKESNWL